MIADCQFLMKSSTESLSSPPPQLPYMNTNTSFPKEKIKILMLEGVHPAALQLFKDHGYCDIKIVKVARSEEDLVSKISKSNIHEEISFGSPAGKELL